MEVRMRHSGLVLTGGGARAAYQVGALHALAEIAGPGPSPFDVVTGISAGAINAAALAAGAEDFPAVVERLRAVWAGLTPDHVYRTGTLELTSIGARWIHDLSAGGLVGKSGINYLLDTAPLRERLRESIPLGRMRRHIRSGRLRGVAISATNYQTGAGVTFFEGEPDVEPWTRSTRIGIRARLTHEHLMASSAIPLLFPPVKLVETYYGDGCVRMVSPLSPAIHLGADRLVAISVRHRRPPAETAAREVGSRQGAPLAVSQIAGLLLDAVFLDSLDSDAERLERINRTLALVPRERLERSDLHLRPVPALVLRPSVDLGKLAADEYERFPAMLRYLLKGIGATGPAGEDFLSYLAFEPIYVNRVMELGHADTMARRREIEQFLLGASAPTAPEKIRVRA